MTSTAIRFGKLETLTTIETDETTIVHSHTDTIHDYESTNTVVRSTMYIIADSRKRVLAEMLKLADKLNEDSVSEIAFECSKRNNGSPYKMSVSWVSK